jgi:hypothetical protein
MPTPPDFTAGTALAAASLNKIGLWEVTSVTAGTGVSSVVVSNCFSSDYNNYKIIVAGGTSSTGANLGMTFGSTATGYYSSIVYTLFATSVVGGIGSNNAANFPYAGIARTNWSHMDLDVFNPFAAQRTTIGGPFINIDATGSVGGFVDNTTSYTGFTLTPNSGTLTGQVITVYGYGKV